MGRANKQRGIGGRFRKFWEKREKLQSATRQCVEMLEGRVMLTGNPTVTGSQFLDSVSGGGQRLIFTFNANVGSTLSTSDLLLQDLDTGQRISPDKMALTFDGTNRLAVVTFPGLTGGVLPDGNYRTILRADGISAGGLALDGNGDGTSGDDAVFSFSFLRGDVNHDHQVDSTDVNAVTAALGSDGVSQGDGDFNGDGKVSFADLVVLAQHYGKTSALPSEGDANLDGVVNFADLVILAQHYNKGGVGDLDGDGKVTNADVQIVQNNLGHQLPVLSPITASLPYDSGISASDGISNNITIDGSVLMSGAVTSLKVGLDAMPAASFASALGDLQPGGGFSFTRGQLEQFAGGPLADGTHVLHLTATNSSNQTTGTDFSFTLKTTATVPVFALAAGSQGSSDHKTTLSNVTLTGTADPGAQITLASGGAATAGADGHFTISGVTLTPGSNLFIATSTDVAGNVSTGNQIIFQLSATQSSGQVALDWDTQALNAIQTDASTPEYASRALAMMSAAMYDAGNSIDNESASVYVHVTAPAGSSDVAAVAQAAHDVLVYIYPAQKSAFDAQLAVHLNGLGATARSNGIAVGQQVAAAIIAMRVNDGSTGYVDYTPGSGAGVWQPTYPAYAPAENPQWATLSPFLMTSDSQFRSAGPPSLSSAQWIADYNQVKDLGSVNSTTRTADQSEIAQFWNDPTGTSTPPGHWNMIADVVAQQKNLSLADATRMLAELNLTLGDAAIVAWDDKYAFNFWRPIQAIPVGGDNGALTADPNWLPLINTPPFPEYVSGHSTFSGAAAAVLDSFFGANTSFTITSTSPGQNGFTRSFNSFDQAAQEAAMSRIYGGIHFGTSVQDGLVAGTALGNYVASIFADQTDTRAPAVTYTTPQNQSIRANETITGQVTDNLSGLKSLLGQFDAGVPFAVTVDSAGNFVVPTVLSTSGSADGLHVLHLVATDNAGNVSLSYDLNFTLDTVAPTITVSAPSAGGNGTVTLLNFETLSGTVDGTGSNAVVLSYQFDSQTVHPLSFDASGAYSQQLDTSLLSSGAHTLHIRATDAAGNTAVHDVSVTLASVAPPMVSGISPAAGSTDIGSTYRPEIFFSRPIDPATLTGNDFYLTDSTGARLATTIVAAQDGTYAWLFPTLALPGGSTITVTVDGTKIRAADGTYLDAAQNGAAAGSRLDFSFSTVRLASLVGTSLSGIVADPGIDLKPGTKDDFSAGADKVTGTADDTFKLPIAGVMVSIIGTSLTTFTDANGLFSFPSVPAGDIKLEVDGTTATNPPAGYYFPQMVMDLNITPGVANTVMAAMQGTGMGNSQPGQSLTTARGVYLPRVESTIFHTVDSTTGPVTINVDPGSVPDLTPLQASELHITAQPNSAIGLDGKPMSSYQIGISAVPAALVMDMLPAGVMQHTFDITIQAPGVAVFTKPVSMTMPNIFGAAAGSQLQFLSFDHTTGRLVIEGTMTVSADGLTVTTDPGTGITHPGWHGQTPPGACSGPGGPPPAPATPPDSGSPDGGAIPAPPIDQINFHAPIVIPMVTGDAASAPVFPTLTWKAPPMPPDLSKIFPPTPPNSCGPPPRPVSPPDNPLPKLTVNITVDGPMDSYLTANGNLPLDSQSFTLEAGTSEVKTLGAIAQSYIQMFGARGILDLSSDILDETTLKIQEIHEASDGSRITDEYTYYLSRFIDIADMSDSDLIVDFPNSQPGVDQSIPLYIEGPSKAFTNNVTGDYDVDGGKMTFNPLDDEPNDLGRLVINAPTGETIGSIGLDGNGLPVQQVYINVLGMIDEFKSLFDAGKMHPSEEAIFGDLDPTDPTHTKYIYNEVKTAMFVGSVLATAELKFSAYSSAISFTTDPIASGIVFNQFSTPASETSPTAVGRASGVDNSNPASPLFSTKSLVTNLANYPVPKQTYILSQSLNSKASGTVGIYLDRYINEGPNVGTWNAANLQLTLAKTIAHETGHQLGLNHTNGFDPGKTDIMSQGYDEAGTRTFNITDPAIRVALGLPYTDAQAQSAVTYYVNYAAAVAADSGNADSGDAESGIDAIDDDNGSENTPLHGSYLAVLNTDHSSIVSNLTFPNTTLGGAGSSINIALFNYGDEPVTIADLTPFGGNGQFQISGVGAGQIIQPGSFVPATITFTPNTLGLTSARLQIDHSGVGGTINVQMSATGFATGATGVVHQISNNFGGVSIHAAQPTAALNLASITNYGQTPLLISGITIAQGAPAFSLTGVPADLDSNPIMLQPGQSYTITGTFAPSITGLQRAIINVTTNSAAQPILLIGATGTGLNGQPHAQWGNDYVSIQIAGAQGFNSIRVQSDAAGNFMSFLPPDSNYTISIFDPVTGLIAKGSGQTPDSGKGLDLTWDLVFKPSTAVDTDGDGLPDDIEQTIGTSSNKIDTDSDGTDDFTAIAQGLDPLGGKALATGILASVPVQGGANAVVLAGSVNDPSGQTAYVATGYGLAIVNTTKLLSPVVQSQMPLGLATGIAFDPLTNVVALVGTFAGGNGLVLIDVSNPLSPQLIRSIPVAPSHVQIVNGVVCVTVQGAVDAFDESSGALLGSVAVATPNALGHENTTLYVLDGSTLRAMNVSAHGLTVLGAVQLPFAAQSLVVGSGIAYVGSLEATGGYGTVNVSDPAHMTLIATPHAADDLDPHMAFNGSGLGLLTADTLPRSAQLFDVSDPTNTNKLLATFILPDIPATPADVAIANGIGYIAEGPGGLVLLNYLSFDTQGVAPSVSITASAADVDSQTAGTQVVAGTIVPINVTLSDDVQARNVELLVNGKVVANRVSFPWNLTIVAAANGGAGPMTIQVRATDTGGNSTLSNLITLQVVPDTQPPTVTSTSPAANSQVTAIPSITIQFSEPLDPARVNLTGMRLVEAGPDTILGTADDIPVSLASFKLLNFNQTLSIAPAALLTGHQYQLTLDPSIISDLSGNAIAAPFVLRFTNLTSAQPMTLGSSFSDQLTFPGQTQTYTFQGVPGQRVYFDSLNTGPTGVTVNLFTPSGVDLSGGNAASDRGPITLTESGIYRLNFAGSGAFSFRLLSDSSLSPVTFGNPNTGTLAPFGSAIYRVQGSAGQRILIFDHSTPIGDAQNTTWSLLGPAGQVLTDTSDSLYSSNFAAGGDSLFATLPWDGVYYLVLKSARTVSTDFSFTVTAPPQNIIPIAFNTPTAGSITQASQTDTYTFQGTAGDRVFVTVYAASPLVLIYLNGPGGESYFNLTGRGAFGPPETLLETGTYSVKITGWGATVASGDYLVQVLDLSSDAAIGLDQTISGTLTPGTAATSYHIDGKAGQHLTLQNLSDPSPTDNASFWALYTPTAVFQLYSALFTGGNTNLDLTLPVDGTYDLILQGNNTSANVNYRFRAEMTTTVNAGPLTLGSDVSGSLALPEQSNVYTFTASAGQVLDFDGIAADPGIEFNLSGPSGLFPTSRPASQDSGPIVLQESGTYTLTLTGNAAGAYRFKLLDAAAAPLVSVGDTVSQALNPGTSTNLYQITGAAGEHLILQNLSTVDPSDPSSSWTIYNSAGTQLATSHLVAPAGSLDLILPYAGTYYLAVSGQNTAHNVPYTFKVSSPDVATLPLPIGQTLSGNLTTTGQQDQYTFTGAAGQSLYLDWLSGSSDITATLLTPSGATRFVSSAQDVGPLVLNESGTYSLIVKGDSGDPQGAYSFRLLDLAAQPLLPLNTPTVATIDPGASASIYRIAGAAGENLLLTPTQSAAGTWTLYAPNGQLVLGGNLASPLSAVLSASGNYTLILSGNNSSPAAQTFTLTSTAGSAIALGTAQNGTLAPSQQTQYTLTLSAPAQLYFESYDSSSSSIEFQFTNSTGDAVFSNVQSGSFGTGALPAGVYTLSIQNTGPASAGFAFRLSDIIANAKPITLGTTVSGSLVTGTAADFYSFTASAGQALYFEGASGANVNVSITAPDGTDLLDLNADASGGPVSLPQSGVYSIVVNGFGDTPSSYAFKLVDITSFPQAGLGATVSGTLTAANPTSIYRVSGVANQPLYFGNLIPSSPNYDASNWTLYDSTGQVVASAPLFYFDGVTSTSFSITPPADGTYLLILSGDPSNMPAGYSFKVATPSINTFPLVLGNTPITGNFTTPGQQDRYTFTGTAGQHLLFDGTSAIHGGVSLFGPNGLLATTDLRSDSNPLILPASGTYTVVLDASSSIGAYSFNLFDIAAQPVISPDTPTSGVLNPGLSDAIFRFAGTAHERVTYTNLLAPGAGDPFSAWSIYDASGNNVGVGSIGFNGSALLPSDGNYILVFQGQNTSTTVAYNFSISLTPAQTLPLTLGQTINGTLNPGTRVDQYSFTGSAGQMLFFDGIKEGNTVFAQLTGPDGQAVVQLGTVDSDNGPFTLSLTGTYTLSIVGINSNSVTYSFRLIDVTTAPLVTLGNTFTGTLGPASTTNIYRVSGTAGEILNVKNLSTLNHNDSISQWNLYDSSGNQLATADLFYADAASDLNVILPTTGTYTLALSVFRQASTLPYSFVAHDAAVTPLTIGNTFSGSVTGINDVHWYTFTGSAGEQVLLDDQVGTFPLTAKLFDTSGQNLLFNFFPDDSFPITLPDNGTYTLSVSQLFAQAGFVGNYTFRLVNVASAAPLTLGGTTSGTIVPGTGANLYNFSGVAGQRIFFDLLSADASDSDSNWSLVDSTGQRIAQAPLSADGGSNLDATLPSDGVYTLVLSGGKTSGNLNYSFSSLTPAVVTTPLNTTTFTSGSLDSPGEIRNYTFDGSAGQMFSFGWIDSGGFSAVLIAPSGDQHFESDQGSDGLYTLAETGTYTLSIKAQNGSDATGDFTFQMLDLHAAPLIAIGATITGTLTPGTAQAAYRINAAAGDELFISNLSAVSADDSSSGWILYDPNGTEIASSPLVYQPASRNLQATLNTTGTYILVLSGGDNTGPVAYQFKAALSGANTFPLTLGDITTGQITDPSSKDNYTFTAAPGQFVYFQGLSGDFDATLISPSGANVFSSSTSSQSGLVRLYEGGTYTLQIAPGTSQSTGSYSFQLLAPSSMQSGDAISGTITPGTGAVLYSIAGVAGEHLFFNNLTPTDANDSDSSWSLFDPTGKQINGAQLLIPLGNRRIDQVLSTSGTYILVINGAHQSGDLSYSFTVNAQPTNIIPMTLDTTVTGNLTQPFQQDDYTFSASSGQTFYFRGLSGSSNIDAVVTTPSGINLFNSAVNASFGPFTVRETGIYTLRLLPPPFDYNSPAVALGAYSFRLMSADAAPQITLGAPVAASLATGSDVALYRITGTAGQRLFFQSQAIANGTWELDQLQYAGTASVNVNQPARIAFAGLSGGFEITLPGNGLYYLFIKGNGSADPVNYAFTVSAPPTNTAALTLGSTISGSIALPGQHDVYTFTATPGQQLFFDALLTDAGNLTATLLSPSDVQLFNINPNADLTQFVTLTEPGPYRLIIQAPKATTITGNYSFRLLDASAAPVVGLNQTVTGTLSPGQSMALYQITGVAGQKLRLTALGTDTHGTWQLIAPDHSVLDFQSIASNLNATLTLTGNYILLFIGSDPAADVNYGFQVLLV